MLSLFYSLIIMFVASFFIQFIIMSFIMINNPLDFRVSYGKLYMSLIMAFFMCLVELGMYNIAVPEMSKFFYIPFLLILIILIYLYRNQVYIQDKDYLKEMIEHHSMAVLTSKNISKKTDNMKVKELSNNIINTQESEIDKMKSILNDIQPNKKIDS